MASDWQRVQDVFDRVLAVPAADRAAALDEACGNDRALRTEVESLLEHHARANDDFLASPAVAIRPPASAADHWAEALVGKKIGRYTLVRLIALGGMGYVFEAQQERPARAVAVKVLRPGFSAPSALARFRLEPEVLGRLQHPNIAQVFEAGMHYLEPSRDGAGAEPSPYPLPMREGDLRADGVPYFAMELIPEAQPLIEYADAHDFTTRQRLELFAKVCDAVQHGHQKGIIHRDLKPANILVGLDGEPKVIDFGVARSTDADIVMTTQYTHVGDLVGTVHYMSPEQCDGNPAAIDTRTDIYSLGVVLYELLTGAAPYDTSGTTVYGAIRVIKDEPPRRPSVVVGERRPPAGKPATGVAGSEPRPQGRGLAHQLRGDLDAILLKALEKDPGRRYASAVDLAQDIRRHLAGEPIEARPPNFNTKVVQWAIRHPLVVTAAACGLMLALTGVGIAIATWYLSVRPDRVVIVGDNDTVELKTVAGHPLYKWTGKNRDSIAYAELLPPPAAPSGGPLVIIGYTAAACSATHRCFAFYDLDRDREEPYQELRLEDADIPLDEIRRRRLDDGRTFTKDDFGAGVAVLADVFPDPGGAAADELVAVFPHCGVTHSAICVFRLDGTPLYRVWVDAHIYDVYWMATPRLLVCAGVNGEALLAERLVEDLPDRGGMHPVVVFAIEPKLAMISSDYIAQEPALRDAAPVPLRPVWYYCVHPLSRSNLLDFTSDALNESEVGYERGDAVTFGVRIVPSVRWLSDPTTAPIVRSWIIRGRTGNVCDGPGGDVYRVNEQSPDKPDNPLAPWKSWYLGELPAKRTNTR